MMDASPRATAGARRARAFRTFYRAHFAFVWHAVGRFGVRGVERGDVVQETFLTAFRRGADALDVPRPWLYGAARRLASNQRRAAWRAERRQGALSSAGTQAICTDAAVALHALDAFLDGLSPLDRELFALAELEGLRGPELAEALRIPQPKVYAQLRALRARLREATPEPALASWNPAREQLRRDADAAWVVFAPMISSLAGAATMSAGLAGLVLVVAASVPVTMVAIGTAAAEHTDVRRGAPIAEEPEVVASQAVAIAPVGLARVNDGGVPTAIRERSRTERTDATAQAGVAPVVDPLAIENAMLHDAVAAIASGDGAAALQATDALARRFPTSPQSDVRAVLRIEALCLAGRRVQAIGEAQVFARRHPHSPLFERARMACRDAEGTDASTKKTEPGGHGSK